MNKLLLDVGGTTIKGTARPGENPVLEFPSRGNESTEILVDHFADVLSELAALLPAEDRAPGHIAMAFPGPFDYDRGIPRMRGLNKYDALYGQSLPELVTVRLCKIGGIPQPDAWRWRFVNDVTAFLLGAMSARRLSGRVAAVTLGTGAGSAFWAEDHLSVDESEGAPPNGWIYPLPFGGSTMEEKLSARGIVKFAQSHCGKVQSALELNYMATTGDENARRAWMEYGALLRDALLPVCERFRADHLVIGGKIALAHRWFDEPLRQACAAHGPRLHFAENTTAMALRGLEEYCE